MQVNLRRERRNNVDGAFSLCWEGPDDVSRSVEAQGRNLSPSGMCVRCATRLPAGTVVFVQGPNGSPEGYAVVRHCTSAGGLHLLGLEFNEETRQSVRICGPEATDYYEFLQISPKAETATIHRIYRFMAARFHPDNPDTGDPERFLLLNRIYEVLSDPQLRAEYDASRQDRESEEGPVAEVSAFVNGIEGEVNRRLAILALLYNKRRTDSRDSSISLWDLERKVAIPREYLDFATWYLKSKGYITVADNSDFALTAAGVDYVEANAEENSMLHRMLKAGMPQAADFGSRPRANGHGAGSVLYHLEPPTEPDTGKPLPQAHQNGHGPVQT